MQVQHYCYGCRRFYVAENRCSECAKNGEPKPAPTDAESVRVQRMVSGIIIPEGPPPGIVEALNNFVREVYAYEETGVWPDNGTIRRLAEAGREALGHRYSANARISD